MKTLINFRLTSFAVAVISLITIPTAIAGNDSVISGAIVQAGWCGQNNYICLIQIFAEISFSVIVICILLDLIINKWFVKSTVDANLGFEPVKNLDESLIGIRVHNNEVVDFTSKVAELKGRGILLPDGTLHNSIFALDKGNRFLSWGNDDSSIAYRDHDLVRIVVVKNGKLQLCLRKQPMLLDYNIDEAIYKFEIEIRGRIKDKPITPRTCCISFTIRKDIMDNRVYWAIVMPTLKEENCNYVKTMSVDEFERDKERLRNRNLKKLVFSFFHKKRKKNGFTSSK